MADGNNGRQSEDKSIEALCLKIEAALELLAEIRERVGVSTKEAYTTADVARKYDREEETVREWCRQERLSAGKLPCGEFRIPHDELIRYEKEGLRPPLHRYRHVR